MKDGPPRRYAGENRQPNEADHHRHLIITGTGRAGTTFLVRYLTALGFDTHLSRRTQPHFDNNANAGLEDNPLKTDPKDLPYVIKSPWLYEYIDELLARGTMKLDGVIIPVRDLAEAAASRVAVELRAIHENAPWMAAQRRTWNTWGWSSGGVAFSLETIDQARLLAMGFHHVVERLVRADVPLVFLSYPRLIHDWKYLFIKLDPYLPKQITEQMACQAHAATVDSTKIRFSAEQENPVTNLVNPVAASSEGEELDMTALRREVTRLRSELDVIHSSLPWKLAYMLRGATKRLGWLRSSSRKRGGSGSS